jgi:transcriptional regulator with XRE-family HTH domain
MLGAHLKGLRQRCGLTQADLATLVGTDQSTISRIEHGVTGVDAHTMSRILQAVECTDTERLVALDLAARAAA